MNGEPDFEAPLTDVWPERRLAANRRLARLMRRLGPHAVDSPDTLAAAVNEALVKTPVERAVLADALRLRAVNEICRLRGTDQPKTYLPILAEALSNQTGHARDLASWAIFTWHDVLDVPSSAPPPTDRQTFTEEA
jgi:hypothetical protein